MVKTGDWGEQISNWMFVRPHNWMMCSESRILRMLAWTLTFPWLIVTVPVFLATMVVYSFWSEALCPALRRFVQVWSGPVCEEENENA